MGGQGGSALAPAHPPARLAATGRGGLLRRPHLLARLPLLCLRLSVEFQRFFTALSVRPGSILAMTGAGGRGHAREESGEERASAAAAAAWHTRVLPLWVRNPIPGTAAASLPRTGRGTHTNAGRGNQ